MIGFRKWGILRGVGFPPFANPPPLSTNPLDSSRNRALARPPPTFLQPPCPVQAPNQHGTPQFPPNPDDRGATVSLWPLPSYRMRSQGYVRLQWTQAHLIRRPRPHPRS